MFSFGRSAEPEATPPVGGGPAREALQKTESTDRLAHRVDAAVSDVVARSQATNEVIQAQGARLIEAAIRLKETAENAVASLTSAAAEVELELTRYRGDDGGPAP